MAGPSNLCFHKLSIVEIPGLEVLVVMFTLSASKGTINQQDQGYRHVWCSTSANSVYNASHNLWTYYIPNYSKPCFQGGNSAYLFQQDFSNRPKALWVSHLNPTQTHTLLWVFCVYFSSQPWSVLQLTDYSSLSRPTWEHFLFSSIVFTFKQTQMKESLLKRAAFNVSPYISLTLNYNKIKQTIQVSHLHLN